MSEIIPYKIFVIEDDALLANEIALLLVKWGFKVEKCKDFQNMIEEIQLFGPHVILMDVNLPSFDGFYWCKEIRLFSNVPLIYVTSRDTQMDLVMGIQTGGDDYIQKPFENNVLIAKIQAIIRRTYEYTREESPVLVRGKLCLELEEMVARYQDEKIELTKNEFKILRILLEKQGQVVSRRVLMRGLWDEEVYVNENTLTVNVNRLRQKLELLGLKDFITTKKGIGYSI